jgi:putative DNA primase/helicase
LTTLFGIDWFTDSIGDLSKKDSAIDLRGKWCAEFSEIEHLIHSEVETVKAFLSRSVDHYRGPYEKTSADYPRQCVLVGTTNATEYLRDATGNRRIWPIRCRSVGSVDREWLTENRDQLWAEAACRESANEPTWFSENDLVEAATTHQRSRMYEDPWTVSILRFLGDRTTVSISELLVECLLLGSQYQNKATANRVGAILTHLGWENRPVYNHLTRKTERKWRPNTSEDQLV